MHPKLTERANEKLYPKKDPPAPAAKPEDKPLPPVEARDARARKLYGGK